MMRCQARWPFEPADRRRAPTCREIRTACGAPPRSSRATGVLSIFVASQYRQAGGAALDARHGVGRQGEDHEVSIVLGGSRGGCGSGGGAASRRTRIPALHRWGGYFGGAAAAARRRRRHRRHSDPTRDAQNSASRQYTPRQRRHRPRHRVCLEALLDNRVHLDRLHARQAAQVHVLRAPGVPPKRRRVDARKFHPDRVGVEPPHRHPP